MKIMQILVLLVATSTIVHAQQPPAANPVQRRPQYLSPRDQRLCKCCCTSVMTCVVGCCLYSAFIMSNESRVKTQIETLQTTTIGKLSIAHFQKQAFQEGLIAGQTMCPTSPMMNREEEDLTEYYTCFCPGAFKVINVKRNN